MNSFRPAREHLALRPEQLRPQLDASRLWFASTAEVPPLDRLFGQQDALDALAFGLDVKGPGFNLYVAGESGSGRSTAVRAHLEEAAARRPTPSDWVLVEDPTATERPVAIALPAGRARDLAKDLEAFGRNAAKAVQRAFESEDLGRRRRSAVAEVIARREALQAEATASARKRGFRVEFAFGQLTSTPLAEGKPVTERRFESWDAAKRAAFTQRSERFEEELGAVVRQLRALEREEEERTRAFHRAVVEEAAAPLITELRGRWKDTPQVQAHLARVAADVAARSESFVPPEPENVADDDAFAPTAQGTGRGEAHDADLFARYGAHVFIDHAGSSGAPVVVETHPTAENLTGRVDFRMEGNGLVTDFRQVRPGALHRANGGFLVLRAADLLQTESAWPVLERALVAGEVRPEAGDASGLVPSMALRPAAIPLDVKVVLVGTEDLYAQLWELDPDFRELFKVKVEFAPDLPWGDEAHRHYAAFLSRCAVDRALRPMDAGAVARMILVGVRRAGDQRRLSTRMGDLADLATEANFWAGRAGRTTVGADDVDRAVRARRARSGLLERSVAGEIARGAVLVETAGSQCGQINALTVVESGDASFGVPARITATVGPGDGAVCSIEREIELAGPIHAKGVLTLRGFLAHTYAGAGPLSLAATLAFEQSYGPIEGDSASLAELVALLSALARAPLAQGIAVTGSLDQRGQVQPVGGVNEKIEGFFSACRAAGFDGTQGVLVPAANAVHLVLDDAVVDAVRAGDFHVWTARSVDDALALLTGTDPGVPGADGTYPAESVHGRVQARLRHFASQLAEVEGAARTRRC